MRILVHELPGRLRFKVPDLKEDPARADALAKAMLVCPGVIAARANALTGSLVVEHDGAPGRRGALLAAMGAVSPPPRTTAPAHLSAVMMMLADAVLQRLVERALRAAVAALI